ncbi:hypothetical protein H4219_004393 [Mycoemilia scoparia]|uniref:Uncharacterized protein n=1 Tax=Mycoemilia scoparia TaxID=417184 RepID=A0A9W8DRG3_9FUNG|nr:hypothetical protein H4219_004393 [Mycoemilia scoparia]
MRPSFGHRDTASTGGSGGNSRNNTNNHSRAGSQSQSPRPGTIRDNSFSGQGGAPTPFSFRGTTTTTTASGDEEAGTPRSGSGGSSLLDINSGGSRLLRPYDRNESILNIHKRIGSRQLQGAAASTAISYAIADKGEIEAHHNGGDDDEHSLLADEPLFRLPIPRQYKKGDLYIHQAFPRSTTPLELFWDLVFVGSIKVVGEGFMGNIYNVSLGQLIGIYIIVYSVLWKVWVDMHRWVNIFGTNDILHRLFVIWQIVCVVCMCVYVHYLFSGKGDSLTFILFYAASKISLALMYVIYLSYLPEFAIGLVFNICFAVIPAGVWLLSLLVDIDDRWIIWVVAGCLEYILPFVFSFGYTIYQSIWPPKEDPYMLVMDLEHHRHRFGEFILITLGEFILNAIFKAEGRFDHRIGRVVVGVIITSCLHWIYYSCEGSRNLKHALYRGTLRASVWNYVHLPLGASIVAMSSAMTSIAKNGHRDQEDDAMYWVMGVAMGISLFCLTAIGMTHKSNERLRPTNIPKWIRLSVRFLVGVGLIVLPLAVPALRKGGTGMSEDDMDEDDDASESNHRRRAEEPTTPDRPGEYGNSDSIIYIAFGFMFFLMLFEFIGRLEHNHDETCIPDDDGIDISINQEREHMERDGEPPHQYDVDANSSVSSFESLEDKIPDILNRFREVQIHIPFFSKYSRRDTKSSAENNKRIEAGSGGSLNSSNSSQSSVIKPDDPPAPIQRGPTFMLRRRATNRHITATRYCNNVKEHIRVAPSIVPNIPPRNRPTTTAIPHREKANDAIGSPETVEASSSSRSAGRPSVPAPPGRKPTLLSKVARSLSFFGAKLPPSIDTTTTTNKHGDNSNVPTATEGAIPRLLSRARTFKECMQYLDPLSTSGFDVQMPASPSTVTSPVSVVTSTTHGNSSSNNRNRNSAQSNKRLSHNSAIHFDDSCSPDRNTNKNPKEEFVVGGAPPVNPKPLEIIVEDESDSNHSNETRRLPSNSNSDSQDKSRYNSKSKGIGKKY